MFSLWTTEKPYRSTNITLESEGMEPAASTEEAVPEPAASTEPATEDESPPPAAEAAAADPPADTTADNSWWSYTSAYTAKLKQQAQSIDYSKITAKIGEKVNKESMESARSNIGSYLNNMYSSVKTSVESIQKEGPAISATIPMLSEFEEEQQKFVMLQERRRGAAVPPWVGYNEEAKIRKQILTLSADERNVMRDPPAGVEFHFDMETHMPVALAMLEHDTRLNDLRFRLVPKVIKEDAFWRNYFYRVSLIKQSAQLATLEKGETAGVEERVKHLSVEPELSMSPQEEEFISDHVSSYEDAHEAACLNEEELKQMGLGGGKQEAEEWEAELEKELQDFEMVEGAEGKLDAENFEAELEEMLQSP